MSARRESLTLHDAEKGAPAYEPASLGDHLRGRQFSVTSDDVCDSLAEDGPMLTPAIGGHCRGRSRQTSPKLEGQTHADDCHVRDFPRDSTSFCLKIRAWDLVHQARL